MSVLHPVGPEPEQTYWRRRALVLGVTLALVIVVATLVANATGGGSAVAAPPPPPPVSQASAGSTESASASPSPLPSGSAQDAQSASPAPSTSGSPLPTGSPVARASAEPAEPAKAAKPAGPTVCSPSDLRVTLTGKQQLKPKQPNRFRLSVINGSSTRCVVKVSGANFEVKVFSGTDRIWSSSDCARAVKPITKKVPAEDAVEWTMTWNGRRSRAECKQRPEVPRPGTYFATAQLAGGKPVQLRMILRG